MPKRRQSKIPQRIGGSTRSPVWSVTRRQRTELSPRRDDETGTTQTYSSRTVTTTERVQMIPMPIGTESPLDMLSSTGESERRLATTTIGSHNMLLVGGVTADGVPLFTGIQATPTTETTTMITTTTTTYSTIEIEDENGEHERELSASERTGSPSKTMQLTLDFPDDYEIVNFEDVQQHPAGDREQVYVVVGKKESPTRTTSTPDYFVKTIDIDLPSSESKESTSVERISDTEINGWETKETAETPQHDYDAHEGTIASTSKECDINQEPIERYVNVYHNGVSPTVLQSDKEHITKEISTVVAKYSGAYKQASIQGEHTVYYDPKTGEIVSDSQKEKKRETKATESPRRFKSIYTVRFSEPFKTQADNYELDEQYRQSEKEGIRPVEIDITEGTDMTGPTTIQAYEGPVESTNRVAEVESEPLEQH
ncbi:unnamed protein product, partial [Gongylonema pulchrum]|uniref:4_1_CTD domain-containing protein n=1 Tax=Gongylonema pulchrum TaxID=637853 RepID=A0A183CU65_9BILA